MKCKLILPIRLIEMVCGRADGHSMMPTTQPCERASDPPTNVVHGSGTICWMFAQLIRDDDSLFTKRNDAEQAKLHHNTVTVFKSLGQRR